MVITIAYYMDGQLQARSGRLGKFTMVDADMQTPVVVEDEKHAAALMAGYGAANWSVVIFNPETDEEVVALSSDFGRS